MGHEALDEPLNGWRASPPLDSGEAHFRNLLEKLPAGAYTCDADGLITFYNAHAERLWGRAPALNDPVDRYCGSFKLFSTDGPPITHERCWMALALQHDRGFNEREIIIERPDGRRIAALAHANPIHDESGKLIGAVNVLVDISDRRRAEEELSRAREAERQRMARDLHDEVLQDLAYALASAQVVHDDLIETEDGASERLGQAIEALKRAGRGVRGAIYDLRTDDGDDIGDLLGALVELNRQRATPGCRVDLRVEGTLPPLLSPATRTDLVRIAAEALTNARRHADAENVMVTAGRRDGGLWIEIADDGRGFDTSVSGTGLQGMHERARRHGGTLLLESEPGRGTRVRVDLAAEALPPVEPEASVARVLLVEDHASFREAVAAVFERESRYRVVGEAGTMAEAREMLDGVDIAVIDLSLPDGFGGDLVEELRARNPHAQALILSANPDRREVAQAVECGAAGVLHKAVGLEEVLHAVRRLRAGETLLPLEEVVELLRYASSRRAEEDEASRAISKLTQREKEVLELLAEGLDSRGVAERLRISVKTERHHVASILAKFGAHSRLQALVFALRHNLVEVR